MRSEEGVSRRALLGRGAVGTAALGLAAPAASARRPRPRHVDVVVVGAGLAGLSAATRLVAAGRSVAVLEARARVGGRTLDVPLGRGRVVELGGQWAGPGQDAVLALARRLGVETFAQYGHGDSLYATGGRPIRYRGDVPPVGAEAIADLLRVVEQINALARAVPADRPWAATRAREHDAQTIESWLGAHARTRDARDLLRIAVESLYGAEPGDVSLLDLLYGVTAVGGDFLTEIGAAQTIRFVGGPQQLAERLARRLGRRVVRSCPVAGITQRERAEVRTARGTWSAREVIVAVPLPLAARLHFDPPLPAAHDQLLQRQPLGTAIKVNAVYDRPFWRSRGLSGSALGGPGPIRVVFDNSPPDGAPGVLVGFFEGAAGARYLRAPRGARRRAALESFAGFFGPRALRPRRYLELVWAAEPYTRGAYGSYNPPGVLTEFGPVRRQPVGRVRFAGADLAEAWPGYMEGAIHDGRRAADEVLTALR